MNIEDIVKRIDVDAARAFVHAARNIIDALLLEAQEVRSVQTPAGRDYNDAQLPRDTPPGGWLSHEEIRNTAQRLSEAIAAEKWSDGVLFTLQLLTALGGWL